MTTTYKLVQTPTGMKGHFICLIVDGEVGDEVLHLPEGTASETVFDTVTALQRAYQRGLLTVPPAAGQGGVYVPEKLRAAYRPGGELHQ